MGLKDFKYFMKVLAVKLTNDGCKNCTSWRQLNNAGRNYYCHSDAFRNKKDPVSGEYQQLKNNDVHLRWNRKLDCKRFPAGMHE